MQDLLDRMIRRALRHADAAGSQTILPHIAFGVRYKPGHPMSALYGSMACIVLQGAKDVVIGDRTVRYDTATSFVASLDLPATGCVTVASASRPYVAAGLFLDRDTLADVLTQMPPEPARDPVPGFGVAPVTRELLEAWDLLLSLLDTPHDIPFLGRSREREVVYRLLRGPHGTMLRQIAQADSRLSRVRRAIEWIAAHYDKPIRTAILAEIAGMSVPSFHRHFKAATAMSPLQYQKRLRLQAARRLLVASGEAGRTAYAVGYESASQFSREYARLFGTSPSRDATRLRSAEAEQRGTI